MQPFLAMITPLSSGGEPSHPIAPIPPGIWPNPGRPDQGLPGGPNYPSQGLPVYPDQGLPGSPPGIWPGPGTPTHPIAPGGSPPGYWGGAPLPGVGHPIAPGGPPPGIWPGPGYPTHPIAPGGLPPGIWGGSGSLPGAGGRPDNTLPPVTGSPTPPGYPDNTLPAVPGGELPDHGDLPDMSKPGGWIVVTSPVSAPTYGWLCLYDTSKPADKSASNTPTKGLPGTWVKVFFGGSLNWAWVPTFEAGAPDQGLPGSQPGVDQGLPGEPGKQPKR